MKAARYASYGPPEVLTVVEVEEPHAGPGQIQIQVLAAGVNPVDTKLRSGALEQVMPVALPKIPGGDAAGTVTELGEGVIGVELGDEVWGWTVTGATAELALMEHWAHRVPGLSAEEAAGFPVAVETAVRVLDLLGVGQGQTVLVNGAAGGVGIAAVQLAQLRGATVIGTASEGNHDYLRSLGVTPTTYGEGMADRVAALAPQGVDRVFDTAGAGMDDLITIAGGPQHIVTINDFTAGDKGVRISAGGPDNQALQALPLVAGLVEQGRFSIPVAATFPLERAAEAHRESETGHVRGKIVILVG